VETVCARVCACDGVLHVCSCATKLSTELKLTVRESALEKLRVQLAHEVSVVVVLVVV
jgi:hypothetical protein